MKFTKGVIVGVMICLPIWAILVHMGFSIFG
jgi:hypothetical protein